MGYYLLFFFVTVGAKLLLAALMIYFLLPADRRCAECDEETILLGGNPRARVRDRLLLGRVRRRWCPRCGWEGLSRPIPEPREPAGVRAAGPTAPTRR